VLVAVTTNRLTLHIEPPSDGHAIAGRICDGRGEEYRFTGWLALLTLLEQARLATAADRSAGPDDCSGLAS
jgi:hypothetical protein